MYVQKAPFRQAQDLGAKSIFLTNNGMSDHIGVAQIVPYLEGLARRGHSIECISVERPDGLAGSVDDVIGRLARVGIRHDPLTRSSGLFRTLDTMAMPGRLSRMLDRRIARFRPDFVHCRSYVPLPAVLRARERYGTPFIFDMRGFWIDQRIESGAWNERRFPWRHLVGWMRAQETRALRDASRVIVLTEDARSFLMNREDYRGVPVDVVPCSVDQTRFNLRPGMRRVVREKLGLPDEALLLAHLGSASPVYRIDFLYRVYGAIKAAGRDVRVLMIGSHDPHEHQARAARVGVEIEPSDLVCGRVPHREVPDLLSAADIGFSLIMQRFSSIGVSATKVGEYLSCGLPVVSNSGVGDIARIIQDGRNGLVLGELSDDAAAKCARALMENDFLPRDQIRASAAPYFSLDRAVDTYDRIYRELLER